MGDATTLLFGLDGFRVVSVTHAQHNAAGHGEGGREVVVEGVRHEQACPDCGVLSGAVHARKVRRVKDLPHGRRPLRLWWDSGGGRAAKRRAGGGRSRSAAGRSGRGSA